MASIVQERMQQNRTPLDKWTTREQLCLASAVSCSGDQNWMSVSRTLKLVCGNGTPPRPTDWYSQKNCALQYGHMLENVDTPKRKKRANENVSGDTSPAVVETPTDLILRRLNDERIQGLKLEIRREQEEFAQIYRELKTLQSESFSEEQMRAMWCSMENQQEKERVEEMRLENQLREREHLKAEMQRNWRSFATSSQTLSASGTAANSPDMTSVDMDVDETIQTSSPHHSGNIVSSQTLQLQQQQQQQPNQPATSPLLSSLLKTQSLGNSTPPTLSTNTVTSTISARSSAPTITTLLTSGYVPNKNQPAITLKAGIPPQKAAQLLSSPISGPPTIASSPVTTNSAQNLLSPSQAAPTLSMLLEKNKGSGPVITNEDTRKDISTQKAVESLGEQAKAMPSDSNNDGIPMDLDEDISKNVDDSNVNVSNSNDSDEPDPNEEQQLLEVFKNIGNIDELDIDVSAVIDDEEVDFLKDMAANSPSEDTNVKDETAIPQMMNDMAENIKESVIEKSEEIPAVDDKTFNGLSVPLAPNESAAEGNIPDNTTKKVETISSDDSNDNIPLAAVASIEQKAAQDKVDFEENDVTATERNTENASEADKNKLNPLAPLDSFEEDNKEHDKLEKQLADLVGANEIDDSKNLNEDGKSQGASESSDVIVIPTDDDDSSGDKARHVIEKLTAQAEAAKIKKDLETDCGALDVAKAEDELVEQSVEVTDTSHDIVTTLPSTISIADTDEDSSITDISTVIRKDDKTVGSSSNKCQGLQVRKSLHEPTRNDLQNKTEDESVTQLSSTSSSLTPVRPSMLRKLRDRDRSESPFTESDTHTTGNITNATSSENASSQRLRRRYSSTLINDSVPNSPAYSDRERDDSETRISKKTLLSIFHALQYSKNAAALQKAFDDDDKFNEICLRQTDMHSIRKHIETGTIRNATELQRDILLMCQNGLMLFKQNTIGFNAANTFMKECQAIREFVTNANYSRTEQGITPAKDNKDFSKSLNISAISTKSRSGSRKSQRIS